MMTKVLVTGGTGYIGSHTVVELQQEGFEVIIVDNLCNSNIEVLNGIEKITGIRPMFENIDCTDYINMDRMFEKYQNIKAIIHFAALKAVGESVEKPLIYYRNNLVSLINLLQLMPVHKIKNIVFSSSCTVYGQPDVLPVREDTPFKPALSPYGNTKQICEEIIRDTIHANPNLYRSIVLRYFNPIGAHPSAEIGELPIGVPNNLLPFITQTAIGIRKQLLVYGNDYNTPDGTCIRDYIDVVDLAKAHVIALKRMLKQQQKTNLEVFNLGTGRGLSVLEIIKTFEKVNGVKVPYKIVGRRPGDIEKVWADPSLANKELGWKAERTLEETLRSAWEWEKKLASRAKEKDHTKTES
ncbi:MAG TPA: UDP-glucose 4-epimerase GalE [Paludibacteraceae bacterium]|nr:UDP-glucose 4-epimerase GalE [Paludibacteraceae bacterium]